MTFQPVTQGKLVEVDARGAVFSDGSVVPLPAFLGVLYVQEVTASAAAAGVWELTHDNHCGCEQPRGRARRLLLRASPGLQRSIFETRLRQLVRHHQEHCEEPNGTHGLPRAGQDR